VGFSIIVRCLFLIRSRAHSQETEGEEPTSAAEEPSPVVRKNTKRKRYAMLRTELALPCS